MSIKCHKFETAPLFIFPLFWFFFPLGSCVYTNLLLSLFSFVDGVVFACLHAYCVLFRSLFGLVELGNNGDIHPES